MRRRRRSPSGGNIPAAYYWVKIMAWLVLVPGVLFGFLMLCWLVAGEVEELVPFLLVFGLNVAIMIIPPIGVLLRRRWGFYLGIIANGLLLLFFPIGTILGGFTMKAFLDSREAFGV